MTIPCIVCGTELRPALTDTGDLNQPSAGTTFTTHGHYGSTVFDPMNVNIELQINVCDPCLVKAAEKKQVLRLEARRQKPVVHVEPWEPGKRSGE